jgi:hypothetical protein
MVCIFDPACELLSPWTKELYLCTVALLLNLLYDLLPSSPPSQTKCTVYTDIASLWGGVGWGECWTVLWTKGVGPGPTLAWPGWRKPDIPVEVDTDRLETSRSDAGVLNKLSLAGVAKLSRLKYRWLRFVWPQPTIMDSELTIGWCTQPANPQLIPQSSMKHLGLSHLV